nr:hypothetical protein HK105_000568 [Polyrhizophydium stewartii]
MITASNAQPSLVDSLRNMFITDSGRSPPWATPRFWARVESSPTLSRAMADPRFAAAASDLAQSPQHAFSKHAAENPQFLAALRELAGILGEEMIATADDMDRAAAAIAAENERAFVPGPPPPPPIPDDLPEHEKKLIARVMADPELQASRRSSIFKDPQMQRMLAQIKQTPPLLGHMLATAPPDLIARLNKLIDCGFLHVES